MKSTDLQSLMSLIFPPEGRDALAAYLSSVVRALNAGSDAGLAQCIGVRSSTIANWKRRGVIPEEYQGWFTGAMIEKIGTYSADIYPKRSSLNSRTAVIAFIVQTNGNPLSAKRDSEQLTAIALPGLMSLAQFLEERLISQRGEGTSVDEILCMMAMSMTSFRHGDQFRAYL